MKTSLPNKQNSSEMNDSKSATKSEVIRSTLGYLCYLFFHILFSPYLILKGILSAKKRGYAGAILKRFFGGTNTASTNPETLIHCAHIGEARTAARAASEILSAGCPSTAILTQTNPAYDFASKNSVGVPVSYAPFNNPISAVLFLLKWKPKQILFVEFCDNHHLLLWARVFGVQIIIINFYITEEEVIRFKRQSLNRWRYRLVTCWRAQTETYKNRLLELGVDENNIEVTGPSFGIDLLTDNEIDLSRTEWRNILRITPEQKLIIGSSLHPIDLPCFLSAFQIIKAQSPNTIILIAPRFLKDMAKIETEIANNGFTSIRRSSISQDSIASDVIMLDTMGELKNVISAADSVFIGGSFHPVITAHSPIEAIAWGIPFTLGQYYQKQEATIEVCIRENLASVCQSSEELAKKHLEHINNPQTLSLSRSICRKLIEQYGSVFSAIYLTKKG